MSTIPAIHALMKPREDRFGMDSGGLCATRTAPKSDFTLPEDSPQYLQDRVVDVEHIRIECDFDLDAKQVSGCTTLTLKALVDQVHLVELDCDDSDVESITIKNRPVGFEHAGGKLSVELPEALSQGSTVDLKITYTAQPRLGIYFTGPDEDYPDKPVQIWTQGQDSDNHHWFPCIDEPKGRLTSEIICTVASDWTVISNGNLISKTAAGKDRQQWHWRQDKRHAVYLITLVAGRFERVELQAKNPPIDIYCQPGREEDAKRTFGNTPAVLKLFGSLIGEPYPWNKYTQVAVQDFIFGGMENTSATTQTDTVLHDEKAHQDFSADFLVAHEAAHQWFGNLLTCREWPHAWLNEGFATYFEALWLEHHKGVDDYQKEILDLTSRYMSEPYQRPIVCREYKHHIDIFDRHLYEKGSLVLHMLRRELGDDMFFACIRHYVKQNLGRNVRTLDFLQAVEQKSGRELEWFFDQWLMRAGHPQFNVQYNWDGTNRLATLDITQKQKQVFRCSLDLVLLFSKGSKKVSVKITKQSERFSIKLKRQPKAVIFDSGYSILKTLEFARPLDMLVFQLKNAPNASDRIEAARSIANDASLGAVRALRSKLGGDDHWSVLSACASAIGQIRTKDACTTLIKHTEHPHLKVRRAIATALGRFRQSERAAKALKTIFKADASYLVSGAAATALGETRIKRTHDFLEDAMRHDSHMEFVRRGALAGLAYLKTARARELATQWTANGRPQIVRTAAVAALGSLGDNHKPTTELLLDLLHDEWFQVRRSAIAALVKLASSEALDSLRQIGEFDSDGRVARDARYATRSIIRKLTVSKRFDEIGEQVAKLEQTVRELMTTCAKLESKRN